MSDPISKTTKPTVRRRLPWWLAPLAMALAMMACIIPAWTSYVLMHRHLAIMEEDIHGK